MKTIKAILVERINRFKCYLFHKKHHTKVYYNSTGDLSKDYYLTCNKCNIIF